MSALWLQNMTFEEFSERSQKAKVILLPLGSTEQHSTHLPLGTDTMAAIALAEDASSRTGAIIAPPLWYGWSPHHMVLPGTVTIRPEVLIELIYDVIQSLAEHGCRNFVVINGHRIVNIPWLQIAAERAQRALNVRVALFDPAYMSKEIVDKLGFGPLGHAEEIESSHFWYCFPQLYHEDKVVDYLPEKSELYNVDPRAIEDTLCYVPSTKEDMQKGLRVSKGVSGSPTRSSREKGKVYHEHLVMRLTQVIEKLRYETLN